MVDSGSRVAVPPEQPQYTLRRVWLTPEEEAGYYYGFSNEALWPLCHIVYERPVFNKAHWNIYNKVNELFADAVLEEIGSRKAFVFIQDYHLALVAPLIKVKNPRAITAQFWHIPWPNHEAFRICPWKEELLEGLLCNDLLGFHIPYHCNNFLETVNRFLESNVNYDRNAIKHMGLTTLVRSYPISVDFHRISALAQSEEISQSVNSLTKDWKLKDKIVGIGADRIDYTKGIPERFKAIDKLLCKYPKYKKKLVFFQLGEPSRTNIPRYNELNKELENLAEHINNKHRWDDWEPIIFLRRHHSPSTLTAFNLLADFAIVSSLHDGMNLVAKEFVSSRVDNNGVLILSQFTGAARELDDALLINPYDLSGFAEAIHQAIQMPPELRSKNMKSLRRKVEENNIYRWAASVIRDITQFE